MGWVDGEGASASSRRANLKTWLVRRGGSMYMFLKRNGLCLSRLAPSLFSLRTESRPEKTDSIFEMVTIWAEGLPTIFWDGIREPEDGAKYWKSSHKTSAAIIIQTNKELLISFDNLADVGKMIRLLLVPPKSCSPTVLYVLEKTTCIFAGNESCRTNFYHKASERSSIAGSFGRLSSSIGFSEQT